MGFGTSASELILFVGAILVAFSVTGALGLTTYKVSLGISEKGAILSDKLKTDFEIINDPDNIPVVSNRYVFYVKNTGGSRFTFENSTITVLTDGTLSTSYTTGTPGNKGYLDATDVGNISLDTTLSSGYHTIKIVLNNGKNRKTVFNVA